MALRDNFRERIRRRRLELGLTQGQVAERMKVSAPLISQAESGLNAPTLEMVERFALALNCTALELLMQPAEEVAKSPARRRSAVA